jgi:2-(1,2-epoxy-1,2-dihydrophenyl)acetyl-CoA isomerase
LKYKTILLDIQGGIATLTLNRPDNYNAMNLELAGELHQAVLECEQNEAVRVVIITGVGKAFCAGGDVKEFHQNLSDAPLYLKKLPTTLHKSISRICRMPKPVIAAVNGVAAGGGFSLTLACDLTMAAESAKFVPAYSEIAASPDLGMTFFLPRLIGAKKAFELAFVKKILTAQEAIEWGIVNSVVPVHELISEVTKIARQLVDSSGLAIGVTKKLFQISQSQTLESQMENETEFISHAGGREDFKEGVTAFVERRKPVFKNK